MFYKMNKCNDYIVDSNTEFPNNQEGRIYLFSDRTIEEWLAIQWWNLDIKIINENLPYIINGEMEILKRKINF